MSQSTSLSAPAEPVLPRRAVPSRIRRVLAGPQDDPVWARPALAVLLVATGVLYVWGLGASGWANSFYSAAAQAGAHSWKAFFFGSSDAGNFITVDKTPLALWPMDLTARLFGVNAWSILVPQALMGVATVGVLYATVRRSLTVLGPRAAALGALLAGAVVATTPVAALMFRFNNPDAMLVLLLTLGAYALLRAQERAGAGWLVLAGSFVGLGFLAKMLQAFLVVPAFALVYLVMAPTTLRRRVWQLAVAGAALIASAGWWVAIMAVIPASDRPYIGGSQHNSVLELALGYNGLGRLSGNETGGLGNTNQDAGWTRMLDPELGGQIAWLLPAALILLVAGAWAIAGRRQVATSGPGRYGVVSDGSGGPREGAYAGDPTNRSVTARVSWRTQPGLAGFVLWGGWLLVTDLVFSLMQGIFHGYYTVALAPPIAALTGMGAAALWTNRHRIGATVTLAVVIGLTAWWSYRLLGRTPDFATWLRLPILLAGLAAAVVVLASQLLPTGISWFGRNTSPAGPSAPMADPVGRDAVRRDAAGHGTVGRGAAWHAVVERGAVSRGERRGVVWRGAPRTESAGSGADSARARTSRRV